MRAGMGAGRGPKEPVRKRGPKRPAPSSAARAAFRPRTSARPRNAILSSLPPSQRDSPAPTAKPDPVAAARPLAPLADQPFQVPIGTIDWLVSREDPAARYVALRDLMARPAKDIELRKARQALTRDPFVRDTLAVLKKKLSPDQSSMAELAKPYDGGLWLALVLLQVGCDRAVPEIERTADVLLTRWEKAFRSLERGDTPSLDTPLFSTVCRTLALIGYGEDPRVVRGAEYVAQRRITAPLDAQTSVTKDLLLFSAIPERVRPELVRRAIAFSVERALGVELKTFSAPKGSYGFPSSEGADRLELLDALVAAGVTKRPEILTALSRIASRADRRARWALGPGWNESLPLPIERTGELSRWVTIRALRVMQHFLGLTVVAAGAKA